MTFVVYEIWTRSRLVDAPNIGEAFLAGHPTEERKGLHLSNWHVVQLPDSAIEQAAKRELKLLKEAKRAKARRSPRKSR